MNSREYVKDNGSHCPYCGSETLDKERGHLRADSRTLTRYVTCYKCGKGWWEVYRITGYIPNTTTESQEE